MNRTTIVVCLLAFFVLASAAAAQPGSIVGLVVDPSGQPVAGAEVRLSGTTRRATTDAEGGFGFEGLRAGRHLLEVESARAGYGSAAIELEAGATLEVQVEIDRLVHGESITVTASPEARSAEELTQAVTVLSDTELLVAIRPTIGETLGDEPGVNQTFYAPGASRPVIRGIGGDRIRVLISGIGSGDASTTSPDHAVAFDPLSTEQIEVVRGPATLLYGSSAVGGVVNMIGRTIPSAPAESSLSGTVSLSGSSASSGQAGSVALDGGGGRFAWHVDGFRRDDDDYESALGEVANSFVESTGGNAGASFVSDAGFVGVSYGIFDSNYGNPGEPEAGVNVDLEQRRYDLSAGLNRELGPFRGFKLRIGSTDYEHRELEGGEVGTLFHNDSTEARLELPHGELGPFAGTVGAQYFTRDFSALGDEAFVPPTETENLALFLFEEAGSGAMRFQVGLRHESQDNRAQAFPSEEPTAAPPGRSFSGLSGSLGLVWSPGEDFGLALSVARSVKLPNAEELYSNGPHIATGAFEIGDPNLDEEQSLGVDLSLRKRSGRVEGQVSFFLNRFDDYIFEQFTDEFVGDEEPLRVVRFVQSDAEFQGAELEAHVELRHEHPHHLELDLSADYVRAEERSSGEPLPRIPPLRFGIGLHYQGESWFGFVEGRHVEEQDRVAEFETRTEGHDLLGAGIGYRFFVGETVNDVVLTGSNLTDEVAQNHISFLKDVALLPGRDVRLTYRVAF